MAVAMMSDDNRRTAEAVAHDLGIERVFAEADVRPEQKADYVRRLQEEGKRVAMVGDSVNYVRLGWRAQRAARLRSPGDQ
jgi:P-type Cu+ transporter